MSDPTNSGSTGMDVAVIGMACRFPGAQNVEQYWQNLVDGVESITRYTPQELDAIGETETLRAAPGYVPVARVVDGIDMFDAAFFGFNPREAEVLDPQQRLFMECVWEALEHAGCDTETFPGLVGVFAGTRMSGYLLNIYANPQVLAMVGDFNAQLANDKDYIATRVSYKLNLGGPSVTVQTACSTSLVALHLACQALLAGDCDLAVAGASSIRIPQGGFVFRDGDVGSPDGRVRAFDAGAQGTIFGSGLGAVVLKRLEDALADGDQIWAVVKGSAITNDGSLKVGYTAPGADGQARVIRAAQITAGVEPDSISYVEAHGTGTPVGDPIEVSALTRAFRECTERTGFCALGSVKPNIGHASAAAGVAGLIKTALALKRRLIPPSILFERPNPEIDFESSPFFVNTCLREWQGEAPLRAGVSAFGIGGTNAHVILEEAPEPEPGDAPARPLQLLVLSARTATALETAAANLARHLEADADDAPEHLADIAWTLQAGRRALEHRRAVVAGSRAEAAGALVEARLAVSGQVAARAPGVAFLFSGQGAQYAGMAAGIYEAEPVFREVVDRAAARLAPRLGLDLRELLFPQAGREEEAGRRLADTALTQPALFVVELALARLWMSWGIAPQAMLGHSIGEYVAACLAGVFSEDEGLELVAARGRLMAGLPAGAMLAVSLPGDEAQAALGDLAGQLALAAVNGPGRSVVAGPEEAVAALEERLQRDGVGCRRLHTSHAFHSQMMEPILPAFLEEVARVDLRPPQLPYVSNLSGTWITAAEATDPGYWVRHLRGTVRFADGLATLFGTAGLGALLEVGPGKALATFARQHPGKPAHLAVVTSLRHPQDAPPDLPRLLAALGQLWTQGVAVDWAAFHGGESRRKVTLPSYPFERRRFWVEAQAGQSAFGANAGPRRNADIADWFYVPGFRPALPPPPAIAGGALQRWLLFADRLGLAERLAERLAAGGSEVVLVEEAAGFARPLERGDGRYGVAAGRREDFLALLDDLQQRGFQPDAVVHAWGVTGEPGGPLPAGRLAPSQERGFWSLIALAQALGRAGAKPVRLAVVADRLFRVLPGDRPCPEKATALGPVRVLPQEMPQVASCAIDVAWSEAGEGERADIVEQILGELAAPVLDAAVAWRGGDRWLLGYQPSRLEGSALPLRLRHQGVYLITGGLGGFGLTFADFLVREQKAKLVLVGRSGLPPREQWEGLVAAGAAGAAADPQGREAADPIIDKIARLLALEAAGGEVLVAAADVADEQAMRDVIAQARARFGGLHGVIHAAGVPGGGLLQLKTREAAERVLAPKVQGLRAIDAALGDAELDFLVLCSSTIAVLGSFGQVDYCAANNYLDAWAQAAAARPAGPGSRGLVLSVNWSAWQEVGMAVNTPPPAAVSAASGGATAEAAGAAAHPAVDTSAPLHALLDARVPAGELAPGQVAFATAWSAGRQWVLDEHRIMGKPAVPGTTWLEVARAAFAEQSGGGPMEIRDLLFRTPLLVAEGESSEGRIVLEQDGDGYAFRIVSRQPGAAGTTGVDGAGGWQEHARGRIAALAAPAARRHDLAALRARCSAHEVDAAGQPLKTAEAAALVSWGPRWQSMQHVSAGEDEALATLELPAEFAGDLDAFELHPALVDVATALASAAVGKDSYLPLSYRRVRIHGPLPGRFHSYIRRTGDLASRETISCDVLLLDDEGDERVAIEGFIMKRVGQAASRFQEGAPAAAAARAAAPAAAQQQGLFAAGGMLPAQGAEVLRRLLSLRRMPQVVASPRDLAALLEQTRSQNRARLLEEADKARGKATLHPRPSLPTPYVAPSDETESALAAIWQGSLGIETVGVHDNFFDLGGDSVLGIQVVARSAEAGFPLSPEQLFEHQTIAELAAQLRARAAAEPAAADDAAAPAGEPAEELPDPGLSQMELDKVFSKLAGLGS